MKGPLPPSTLLTYSHRILHIGYSTVELWEMELWAVRKREIKVTTSTPSLKHCCLAVLTVAEYSSMILACGNTLEGV